MEVNHCINAHVEEEKFYKLPLLEQNEIEGKTILERYTMLLY